MNTGFGLRSLLAVLLALGLMSLAAFLFTGRDSSGPEKSGSRQSGYFWAPGTMQSYHLSMVSDVTLTLPGASASQDISQRVSGTLHMRVFDADNDRIRVGFQLNPANYRINGQVDDEIENDLGAPFVTIFQDNGRPDSFQFPAVLKREARVILEEAIRNFQVILPGTEEKSWTVAEEHALGKYSAHYQMQEEGSIRKEKTGYTEVNLPFAGDDPSSKQQVQLKKYALTVRMSPGTAWITSADLEERQKIMVGLSRLSESSIRAKLELLETPPNPEIALFREGDRERLLNAFTHKAPQPPVIGEAGKIPGGSAATDSGEHLRDPHAEQKLTSFIMQLNGDKDKRIVSLRGLLGIVRDQPDLAYKLMESIGQSDTKGTTDAFLILVLGQAGTPEAQDALVMVMNDSSHRDWNRLRAIFSLAGLETVNDETLAALFYASGNRLVGEANDQANSSLLAIGALGGTLHESDPEKALKIRDHLSDTLRNTRDSSEAHIALKAMANMGDPELADTIVPFLDHSSPSVRSAAAEALGNTGVDYASGLLTEQLETEPNVKVRLALVSALESSGTAPLYSLQTVRNMVTSESDAGTRYHMTKYLGNNMDVYPEGERALRILSLKDSSSRVRQQAASDLFNKRNE